LKRAAPWADEVKHTHAYAWSEPLHFVDAQDNPSQDCNFDQQRDCSNGKCLTAAIANYTSRIACGRTDQNPGEAVKFLTHFLGDITQPLHVCARQKGGNGVIINYARRHTLNLHYIWDDTMIETRLKTDFGNDFNEYLNYLSQQLQSTYASEAKDWKACIATSSSMLDCAITWATESDTLDCEVVWGEVDAHPKEDLSQKYYKKAIPVIEKQLAKAAVRIAALLDARLGSCESSPDNITETKKVAPKKAQ